MFSRVTVITLCREGGPLENDADASVGTTDWPLLLSEGLKGVVVTERSAAFIPQVRLSLAYLTSCLP